MKILSVVICLVVFLYELQGQYSFRGGSFLQFIKLVEKQYQSESGGNTAFLLTSRYPETSRKYKRDATDHSAHTYRIYTHRHVSVATANLAELKTICVM